MRYVVDSYSWIDYLSGNIAGEKVKEYIENPDNEIITNILNIAEISSFFERENVKTDKREESFNVIISTSRIYNFDPEFSKEAGLLHGIIKRKINNFGLIDSFVLLTARKLNAKIITGDEHFKRMKEAVFIK